jgi:hypothetical protein
VADRRSLVTAGLVVGTAVGALAMYVGSDDFRYGGRDHIDLHSWVEADDSWTRATMPGAAWATDELCGAEVPCVQAVRSDTLTMYRFEDRDDAAAAARGYAGEGYLSGWIVVQFEPGGLTASERSEFAGYLDCVNVGVAEGGLEC